MDGLSGTFCIVYTHHSKNKKVAPQRLALTWEVAVCPLAEMCEKGQTLSRGWGASAGLCGRSGEVMLCFGSQGGNNTRPDIF